MNTAAMNPIVSARTYSPVRASVVTFTAALFFFYEFVQLNMFNSIGGQLVQAFSIEATQLGNLSATYLYGNVLFLFPAGMILDRFSTRKVISLAMLLCVVSTYIFGLTSSFAVACFARFMIGLGGSFCLLSCIRLASHWFPLHRLALVTGLIITIAMLGGVVAQTPLTYLLEQLSWREVVRINAIGGAILILAVWFFVQDFPDHFQDIKQHGQKLLRRLGLRRTIFAVLANVQNWLCGLYTSLLNLPILVLGAVWGTPYLVQAHHLTKTQASYIISMIFFGTIVGSPLVGWISDRLRRRRMPMILGAILSIITIFIIMFIPDLSETNLIILFFLLGLFTSSQVIGYPVIAESNPTSLTGSAVGVASVLIMGGGAVAQYGFGRLLDLGWDGTVINGIPLYSPDNYLLAVALIPVAFILGLICAIAVRETNCQQQNNKNKIDDSPQNRGKKVFNESV